MYIYIYIHIYIYMYYITYIGGYTLGVAERPSLPLRPRAYVRYVLLIVSIQYDNN